MSVDSRLPGRPEPLSHHDRTVFYRPPRLRSRRTRLSFSYACPGVHPTRTVEPPCSSSDHTDLSSRPVPHSNPPLPGLVRSGTPGVFLHPKLRLLPAQDENRHCCGDRVTRPLSHGPLLRPSRHTPRTSLTRSTFKPLRHVLRRDRSRPKYLNRPERLSFSPQSLLNSYTPIPVTTLSERIRTSTVNIPPRPQ